MVKKINAFNESCYANIFFSTNNNFGFRKIALYLASKIDFEIWKYLIFDGTASSCLTRYKQILSVCSFWCENVLNFTCFSKNFPDYVHAIAHLHFLSDLN